jgi:hypothetical protein
VGGALLDTMFIEAHDDEAAVFATVVVVTEVRSGSPRGPQAVEVPRSTLP